MKMFIKISALFLIASLSLLAQIKPDVSVYYNSSMASLCTFNFINPIKINNDYLYVSLLTNVDSVKTDTLIFAMSVANKIFIRNISFSRNGQIYCSTDSFPTRDSINFKGGRGDSLFFQDSVLGVKIKSAIDGRLIWYLKQQYLFCKYDTLKLLLTDSAQGIPTDQINSNLKIQTKPTNLHHEKKFMLLEKESGSFSLREQQSLPLFDVQGKKHGSFPKGSSMYIIDP